MSTLSQTGEITVSLDNTLSKSALELRTTLETIAATATPADLALVERIRASGAGQRKETITPAAAAVLVLRHNDANRDLSIAKVDGFVADMKAGDWKFHHQGIAFTPAGKAGDGQHRLAACAVSGVSMTVMVTSDFDIDAIDAIDRSTRRTAGQALAMRGVTDAGAKAQVCKTLLDYRDLVEHGRRPRLSDMQIERATKANEAILTTAIEIGRSSTENVGEPYLKWNEAAGFAAIALYNGWDAAYAAAFLASVQQGVATSDDSPILHLSKLLGKARRAERTKDKLNLTEKLALTVKAASAWSRNERLSRLTWDARREGYPMPTVPPNLSAAAE